MWHQDEGTYIYSIMVDGVYYFLDLLFRTLYALFSGIPLWGYAILVIVVILVLLDRANIGAIVETSTDKSQGGTS